ncbi:MAG: ATP-binding cassette domain-containing protein, partial [Actinomycetota bacterium]
MDGQPSDPAIRTENLTKFYSSHLGVEDVSFEVAPGEVVGFLGPNGSGKTTVLRMLVGLISITRGRAHLLGRDVALSGPSVRAEVGYLPGTLGLYEHMTALHYFEFLARMRRLE